MPPFTKIDTFKMVYIQLGPDLEVTMSQKDITWPSEKNHKFRNPSLKNVQNGTLSSALRGFGAPLNWQNPVHQLSPYEPDENGFLHSDLIEWMRTAAFPSFRKLYRRITHSGAHFEKGLPKGNYRMDIKYSIFSPCSYLSPLFLLIYCLVSSPCYCLVRYCL